MANFPFIPNNLPFIYQVNIPPDLTAICNVQRENDTLRFRLAQKTQKEESLTAAYKNGHAYVTYLPSGRAVPFTDFVFSTVLFLHYDQRFQMEDVF